MLLIDMSNLVYSRALGYHTNTGDQVGLNELRGLTLTTIKEVKTKLSEYSDEVVLCFDSANYWRRNKFPQYKENRKSMKEKSTFDWNLFHETYDKLKKEFKENLPFHFILVDEAEGDDVIAVLAKRYSQHKKICIVSSDTDFIQLQQYVSKNIKQYSLHHKKLITPKNQEYDIFEHIVRGDTGDGIPNILSDDDTLINPDKRQKSITSKNIAEWSKHGLSRPEMFCDENVIKKFERNKLLVDLREIPENICQKIVETFENTNPKKGMLHQYLTATRLLRLVEDGKF